MKIKSPAKINLFLKLLEKKSDGFHELESLFAFLDLTDDLEVKKSDKFKLEISGEFAEFLDPKKNLFTKILDFFVSEFHIDKNLHIKIQKNIPVAAGLGGGSSNAACFMKILNEIFSLNLSKIELQKISLNFGSDIAFFFENHTSIIRGRGEKIKNFLSFNPILTLLINPKIELSTKEIYEKFDGKFSTEISNEKIEKTAIFDLIKNLPNDLEKPAIATLPLISEILSELRNFGADFAKMSGSGATCFGTFSDEETLESARKNLAEKFPKFFVKKAKILCNHPSTTALRRRSPSKAL
jgi:4-diphosphocytidyl-2-C-methyl-D-erythritol kinase